MPRHRRDHRFFLPCRSEYGRQGMYQQSVLHWRRKPLGLVCNYTFDDVTSHNQIVDGCFEYGQSRLGFQDVCYGLPV